MQRAGETILSAVEYNLSGCEDNHGLLCAWITIYYFQVLRQLSKLSAIQWLLCCEIKMLQKLLFQCPHIYNNKWKFPT